MVDVKTSIRPPLLQTCRSGTEEVRQRRGGRGLSNPLDHDIDRVLRERAKIRNVRGEATSRWPGESPPATGTSAPPRRQPQVGRVARIVEEGLVRHDGLELVGVHPTRVEVSSMSGEVAGRHVQADPVAAAEHQAGGSEIDLDVVGFTGSHRNGRLEGVPEPGSEDPVAHVEGAPVREDVHQLGRPARR